MVGDGNGNGNGGPSAYDATYQHAGEECSSTGEGRYVNIIEEVLLHPWHDDDDDLVRKGDPCCTFELVGVAMMSANNTDDAIVIDTEGIWWLNVTSVMNEIYVGQRLYITDDGIITDDIMDMPFGWALAPVGYEETELIAVKVHSTEWNWWLWL